MKLYAIEEQKIKEDLYGKKEEQINHQRMQNAESSMNFHGNYIVDVFVWTH